MVWKPKCEVARLPASKKKTFWCFWPALFFYVTDLFSCGPWRHHHLYTVYFVIYPLLSTLPLPKTNSQSSMKIGLPNTPKGRSKWRLPTNPAENPPPATCIRHVGSSKHPRVNQQTPTQPSSTKETTLQKTYDNSVVIVYFNHPIKLWPQMNDIRSWWLEYYISPYSAVLLNLMFWTIWHSNLKHRVDGPRLGWNTA